MNISRISANLTPNFYEDNTGVTIDQAYIAATATSGTVSVIPSKQNTYVNLTTALTGNIAISVNATYSMICDTINVMVKGGSSAYVLTFDGDIKATGTTVSVTANKTMTYTGTFNGTNFIGHSNVQI